jgi:excisionase family DNA binding protein
MPDDFNPTEWITTAEAAELTGYHVKYLRRLVREGKIAGAKRGRELSPRSATLRAAARSPAGERQ